MSTTSRAPSERILLLGGSGLLGSELKPLLESQGFQVSSPSHAETDCRLEAAVRKSVRGFRPQMVVMAAAQVGGILANIQHGTDYLYDNALMNLVTLRVCAEEGVGRVLVFGSSCMYPSGLDRPITPEDLLAGPVEQTSVGYAVGKIAGVEYALALRREGKIRATVCVLTSLYGDKDRFSAEQGHLVSSLIVRMHQAKEAGLPQLELWGNGKPRRDFLHASDAARAVGVLLEAEETPEIVHVGSGRDFTVREIAIQVAEAVGFTGKLVFGGSVPSGTFQKLLAADWIFERGWKPRVSLQTGLRQAYQAYLAQAGAVPCRP